MSKTETLTLPGTIPDLLRSTSPLVATTRTHTHVPEGQRGVAVGLARRAVWQVAWVLKSPSGRMVGRCAAAQQSALALDLTHATGRQHARCWLAGTLRERLAGSGDDWATALEYAYFEHFREDEDRNSWRMASGWFLQLSDLGQGAWLQDETGDGVKPGDGEEHVPALDALDPEDERVLPDGSLWVRAEALRLVCLHVAKVTPCS